MNALSRGYLSLRSDDVRLEAWSIGVAGSLLASPSLLQDWTYYQAVDVHVTLLADLRVLHERLNVGPDAALGAVIIWASSGTSLRGASRVVELDPVETSVAITIPGDQLRGTLALECQVILLDSGLRTSSLAPSELGSILWAVKHSLQLEGIGSRMPTVALPFSQYFIGAGEHGLWHVHVGSEDLYAAADSALWIWLNDENSLIEEMLNEPEGEGSRRTQQFLKLDVFRQIVELGLRNSEFSLGATYPDGSLGAVIAGLVRMVSDDLTALRQQFRHNTQIMETELQIRLGAL